MFVWTKGQVTISLYVRKDKEARMDVPRGMCLWCAPGGFHPQPTRDQEEEIIDFVKKCAKHGVTRLFPSMTSIRSDYFPRFIDFEKRTNSSEVPTMRDFYSTWHPLKTLVSESHGLGIEVHPYINFNLHGTRFPNFGSALNNSNIFGAPVNSHLAIIVTSRFASENLQFWSRDRSGRDSFQIANEVRLSPAFKEVRLHEQQQLIEVVRKYSPDGVQIEFSQEPADEDGVTIYGYEEPAIQAYTQRHGKSPLEIVNSDQEWIQLRCDYITEFMKQIRVELQQFDHPIPMTASIIAPHHPEQDCHKKRLRDWPAWARKGLIDTLYLWFREFVDLDTVPDCIMQAKELLRDNCPLVAEFSCYHRGSLRTQESLINAARLALKAGANAIGIYRADAVEAFDLWEAVAEIATISMH
jgi:uncharacterized lipoprotein YddW (UPF0748 family)